MLTLSARAPNRCRLRRKFQLNYNSQSQKEHTPVHRSRFSFGSDSGSGSVSFPIGVFVETRDFCASNPNYLECWKGERVNVLRFDRLDGLDLAYVETRRGERGVLPVSILAPDGSRETLETKDWWHGRMNRDAARRVLREFGNSPGTFLVREGDAQNSLSLSVYLEGSIKHYSIKRTTNGRFCIKDDVTFRSLPSLIQYYSCQAHGLCCSLASPCPKPLPATIPGQSAPEPSDNRQSQLENDIVNQNEHAIPEEVQATGGPNPGSMLPANRSHSTLDAGDPQFLTQALFFQVKNVERCI